MRWPLCARWSGGGQNQAPQHSSGLALSADRHHLHSWRRPAVALLPLACALYTSRRLRVHMLAFISLSPFFVVVIKIIHEQIFAVKDFKKLIKLLVFSGLCHKHGSFAKGNHYILFSDSSYLLCMEMHIQGKKMCFLLFLNNWFHPVYTAIRFCFFL